jgi:hypothetical protein
MTDLTQEYTDRLTYQKHGLPDGFTLQRGDDGMVRYAAPPSLAGQYLVKPDASGDIVTPDAASAIDSAVNYIADMGQGLLHGASRGAHEINRMIPGAPAIEAMGGAAFDAMGIDSTIDPPTTLPGQLASGLGQALPGMIPAMRALKMAGYGPAVADIVGGIIGDFATSGKTEADGIAEMIAMIPGDKAQEISQIVSDFVTSDNATIQDLNSRLVGALPGAVLGPLVNGLGSLVVMAKNSGAAQDIVTMISSRWAEGKSPVPVGMSIEDVSGTPFAPEITETNIRQHRKRIQDMNEKGKVYPGAPKNPRRVITAPQGSGLPDFVIGDISPEDWVARTQQIMSPEDISAAAKWYDEVNGEFLSKTSGDQEKASRLMGAWLAAQQNESPANAMTNVLYMWEQLSRGVPVSDVKGKGLPSANKAALAILSGDPIDGGVGQKIADFIDAGKGRNTRSIMGDAEDGGQPFVVDIHTARDTGLVDQTLLNHLERLGYDVPDDVIVDVGQGGIKGPMYENRALFGQRLTQHLNDIGWMGRSDWKPKEAQAIGWMGLTRMYGNSSVGGDTASAFGRNVRRISMEAAPGEGSPAAIRFGEQFEALAPDDQRGVTFDLTQKAIEKANERFGLNISNVVHATGGWQRFTNPSTVQQAISSKEGAQAAANYIGYILQQTEVWVNSAKAMTKNPKAFAVDIIEVGTKNIRDDLRLAELWDKIISSDETGLIQGYQPIELEDGSVGIRILVNKVEKGPRGR